tara:strand:+ start:81 stop:794 length:714 start_codon:yes stop_codon:yes gene_type:complete
MATTTATITLASSDLLSDELALTTTATLTQAGNATGVTQASGLSRKTTSAASAAAIQANVLYRASDYTADGANKVYIKNTSTTAAEFYTVHIDQEEIGRLYAGDWMFMPWNATSGAKQIFVVTFGAAWLAGETWTFDGITATSADTTEANFAALVHTLNYPNWTTTYAGSGVAVSFTARRASDATEVAYATADATLVTTDGTAVISDAVVGSASESDITIRPSVHTDMTYETMLIHQ